MGEVIANARPSHSHYLINHDHDIEGDPNVKAGIYESRTIR